MQEQPDEIPNAVETQRQEGAQAQILDQETVEKIRLETTVFLEGFYGRPSPKVSRGGHEAQEEVEQLIATLTGSEEEYEERRFTPAYRAGVKVFLERLIDFVAEKEAQDGNEKETRHFLAILQEEMFSWSPNITNQTGLDDQLILTAKANRVPATQGWFGGNMVGEIAYELSFCDDRTVSFLVEKISKNSIPDVLDIIHQLQTVGAHAAANGDWAEAGLKRSARIVRGVSEKVDSPIVRYAADLVIERLEQEYENPTGSVLVYHGDKGQGRIPEGIREEFDHTSSELSGRIHPDSLHVRSYDPLPIASDAVGYFDHSLLPRYFGQVDFKDLPEAVDRSPRQVRAHAASLANIEGKEVRIDPRDLGFYMLRCNATVIDQQRRGEIWHNILPSVSAGSWEKVFGALERERAREAEAESKLAAGSRTRAPKPAWGKILEPFLLHPSGLLAKMGVYAWQEASRLESDLKKIHVEKYEDVVTDSKLNPFTKPEDENLPLLLQHLHRPEMRLKTEEDLDISLLEIPLRSQIHFLKYLSGQDNSGFERIRNVLHAKKEESTLILKCFLANAEDPRYSEALLTLAERLDAKTAAAVFGKYAEIADASERARGYIQEHFSGRESFDQARVNSVVRRLLHHGNEFLVQLTKGPLNDPEAIAKRLENTKTEILMFASAFKIAAETGPIEFADIAGIELTSKDSSLLNEAEKKEMLRIYEDNRFGYTPGLLKETIDELARAFESPGIEFYILKNGSDIVAFIRFDSLGEDRLYAASLNVRPEVRGSTIGSAMLRATLDKKAETCDIEAVAYEKNPMLKHYLEDFGFSITGKIPNYKNSGELFYKLERPRATTKVTLH